MANYYKGSFVNTQVDYSDNSPNEQTIYLKITDLGASNVLPYGLNFWADSSIGDNNQLMNVSWDDLPADTTSLVIGYKLETEISYTDITITSPGTSGFHQWISPYGNYDIRFQVVRPGGTEEYFIYSPTTYELEMADSPIVFQTVDNSEDKFTTIKSKSCTIRVFTNDDVNAMAFANGGDNQYKVEVAVNDETAVIFSGWLSISDLGQTFQPDPNVLVLTATDGLGFLRDLPLSDDDGRYLTGPHPLIKLMAWCFKKTGLNLDIWVQMNLIENHATYDVPANHFYNYVYTDAKTFEAEINQAEDCFSVLQKILGEFCELSQDKNRWFIKSIDEAGYSEFRICRFDYNGEVIDYQTKTYQKLIGPTDSMAFMNDDARLSLQRPYKTVTQTYNYDYPAEIIGNIGFDRGDLLDDTDPLDKTYIFDNWTVIQGVPGYYAAPSSSATIHRIYNADDYEIERYVVLTPKPWTGMSLNLQTYARSEAFYIHEKDKFYASVDWRLPNNIGTGGANYNIMQVVLHGDDGSWWLLGVPTIGSTEYAWYNTSNWTTNTGKGLISVDWDIDLTEWQNVSWDAPPCPVSGSLYIWLYQFNQTLSSADDVDIWYSNLSFDYVPYVNGSYQKYTGQAHTSEQSVDNKATRENQVYVSDAPKRAMKGCMIKILDTFELYNGPLAFENGNSVTLDGFQTPYFNLNDYVLISGTATNNAKYRLVDIFYSAIANKTVLTFDGTTYAEIITAIISGYTYEMTDLFYDSIKYPYGVTVALYPYGQHQNQAVWNQFNRVFTAFEATIDGLDTDTVDTYDLPDLPDLMHEYEQTDPHPATTNKQFKVLHYEQDTDNCEWSLYMMEVSDSTIPKSYDGHSFKYVQK